MDTSLMLFCDSWLCTGAEIGWLLTRDACGPYEQRCPSL